MKKYTDEEFDTMDLSFTIFKKNAKKEIELIPNG